MPNDQRCTPFWQNIWDFTKPFFGYGILYGKRREDGRGWFKAVTHEGKNVLVESWRQVTGKCPDKDVK